MKLSQGEKLILLALAYQQDGKEPLAMDLVRSAILSGNTWALSWELPGVPDDVDPAVARETADILSMWSFIEHSVSELKEGDRETLRESAYPYSLEFEGFDGNHDDHHGVADFLIRDMRRFDEFKDRSLNSHSHTSLPHYRRMLSKYREQMSSSLGRSGALTQDVILSILKPV